MKKAEYTSRGPVPQEVISAVDFELPPLVSGQALVQVLAAPINPSDVLTLTGEYGILPPLPAIGGNEGVGRVLAVAPDVVGLPIGQTVLLPIGCGTWRSHLITEAKRLLPLPNGVDPRQLAMLVVNPPTALLMLTEIVPLQPGEWVIQNAANSAVGTYLMQLAKLRGLRTVNVVRRESALAAVKDGGGDVVLVDGDDLSTRVKAATAEAKIRLGIDAVGGMATERMARCLAEGGTVVNYGAMSSEACQVSPASLIFRGIALRGFWLSKWFRQTEPARQKEIMGELVGMIATGKLKAKIQAEFPVDKIKEAVALAAAGERDGKILIVPQG